MQRRCCRNQGVLKMMEQENKIGVVSPTKLQEVIANKERCHVIDVREMAEINMEHIEGATPAPLSSFDRYADLLKKEHPIYILCRTGNRAKKAAQQLQEKGYADIHIVSGGIEAWKAQGLVVKSNPSKVWSLERQVRFTAGLFVLVGVALAYLLNPLWVLLSAGVGAGLMFAAATDTCGMGLALARMPWNKMERKGA